MNQQWGPPGAPGAGPPQGGQGQQGWGQLQPPQQQQYQPTGGYGQPYQQQPQNGPYRYGAPINMAPDDDERTLKILSILNYVYAGLIGLFGLMYGGIGLVTGGLMTATAATAGDSAHDAAAAAAASAFMLIIFGGIAFFAILFAALHVIAGRKMTQHKGYVFCIIMACLSLLSMPFGTLLGVFTLITLSKPNVKAMFARAST